MDMGGHGDMASGPACKMYLTSFPFSPGPAPLTGRNARFALAAVARAVSMLWNWNTVDSCFLSSTWHVRSKGGFAGSVIGVFLLTIAIEFVRRVGREYDRRLILAAKSSLPGTLPQVSANKDALEPPASYEFRPSWPQQLVRGFAYGTQFTAAFLVMLLGMYYNGYMLFAIFLGQTLGYVLFGRDTCTASVDHVASGSCC